MSRKGIYTATKQQLIDVALPETTRTYKAVSNEELMNLTLESIYQAGFQLDEEIYASAREGNVANGRFLIKSVDDAEMQLQVSWQNSYNKSLPIVFSIGAMVKVCTNGMMAMRGIGSFKKKHSGDVQTFTPQMISEYIKGAGELFLDLQKDRDLMKQVSLTKRESAELLGRLYIEENLIESAQLNIIKRELEHPSIIYNNPGSLWELYNFTTFALRDSHPSLWMNNHVNVHEFFNSQATESSNSAFFGFDTNPSIEEIQVAEVIDDGQLTIFDELARQSAEAGQG